MPKNVYADRTINTGPILAGLVIAAVAAVLYLTGAFNGIGSGGLSPAAKLEVAKVQVVEATQAAEARRQAEAERQMSATNEANAQAQTVRVTEQARADQVAATIAASNAEGTAVAVRAQDAANNNATATAYPPTATAQAVQDAQDAERVQREGQATVNAWATQGAVVILDATATREAENRAEDREDAKVTQGWLIAVLVLLTFASVVACIILMARIWFIHIKPLAELKKKVARTSTLADVVPELCRRLQEMEDWANAEKQGDTEVPPSQES